MNIEWTLCSERMPPDDESRVICRFIPPVTAPIRKCMGRNIWQFVEIRKTNPKKIEWTPFTQEKWEFLNR